MKQSKAQIVLKTTNLMADRGRRHGKLFAGLLETEVTRGRFKGAQ